MLCQNLEELKTFVDGDFFTEVNVKVKQLNAILPKRFVNSYNTSKGRTLSGIIREIAFESLLHKYENINTVDKQKDGLFLQINKKKFPIKIHFSDGNLGSSNIGSPDVIWSEYTDSFCKDYLHIFLNGISENKISEVSINTLSSLIDGGFVTYPLSYASNQLQLRKEKSISPLREVPLVVKHKKKELFMGILTEEKMIRLSK